MLRARRIQAHSVIQEDQGFHDYATGKVTLTWTGETFQLHQSSPPNAELFESFAARVRPVTLDNDSSGYRKTLKQLSGLRISAEDQRLTAKFRHDLQGLPEAWREVMQPRSGEEGWIALRTPISEPHRLTTATLQELAEAWMYSDLVHSAKIHQTNDALQFPLRERYQAAVTFYSRVASRTFYTATMLEVLHSKGFIELSEEALHGDVSLND